MKKTVKIFIVYFPVILVSGQVLINLLSFLYEPAYKAAGFYLNTFFGTNVFFALFLVAFTWMFKFCSVSKWAALAECLFAINYLVVKEDNLYNISFQIIVGLVAIAATYWNYLKKFPLCRWSLFWNFIGSVISNGSCKKGLIEWERNIKSIILKTRKHDH
jgi:hypothetical protein